MGLSDRDVRVLITECLCLLLLVMLFFFVPMCKSEVKGNERDQEGDFIIGKKKNNHVLSLEISRFFFVVLIFGIETLIKEYWQAEYSVDVEQSIKH